MIRTLNPMNRFSNLDHPATQGRESSFPNRTGSASEGVVDRWMAGVQRKVSRVSHFLTSPSSLQLLEQANKIGPLVLAVILGWNSPITALASFSAGVVVRAFSPEQLDEIHKSFQQVDTKVPQTLKALVLVAAVKVAPLFSSFISAFYAGTQVSVSPHRVANTLESLHSDSLTIRSLKVAEEGTEEDKQDFSSIIDPNLLVKDPETFMKSVSNSVANV